MQLAAHRWGAGSVPSGMAGQDTAEPIRPEYGPGSAVRCPGSQPHPASGRAVCMAPDVTDMEQAGCLAAPAPHPRPHLGSSPHPGSRPPHLASPRSTARIPVTARTPVTHPAAPR